MEDGQAQPQPRTPPASETQTEEVEVEADAPEICMICGQHKTEGIHILYGFICEACELEIVRTDVMDAKYPFFVNRMKQLFYKKDA